MTPQTQSARILEILRRGETISQLEAARWDNPCLRLGARIWDLRHGVYDGTCHDIEELTEKNGDGKGTHARYRMRSQPAQPAPRVNRFLPPEKPAEIRTGGMF